MQSALVLIALMLASPPAERHVALVVDAPPDVAAPVLRSLLEDPPQGVLLEPLAIAPAPPPAPSPHAAAIEEARSRYVDADFAGCLSKLEGLPVHELLAAGERALATRLLVYRVACRVGAGGDETAPAELLAKLGLDASDELRAVSPEVEAVVARAISLASSAPRAPLAVEADRPRAEVSIDGASSCKTPCIASVALGDHLVRVDATGATPSWRVVAIGAAGAKVSFALEPAAPAVAAAEWSRRYARSSSVASDASLALLWQAAAARPVLLLSPSPSGWNAALFDAGRSTARAEGSSDATALARSLLESTGFIAPPPPLLARPIFWLVAGGVVLATTGALLAAFAGPIETRVRVE